MTDFVLSSGNSIRPHRSPWGSFPLKRMNLSTGVSSNQIYVGSVVGLDQVAASTNLADAVVIIPQSSRSLNPAAGQIVGISAEFPSSSVPGSGINLASTVAGAGGIGTIMVYEANPNVEFKAWTRFGLLTSTIVSQPKELTRDSTLNIDLINLATSSLATPAKCVIITSLIDASGDSGGAVTFRFNTSSGFLAFYR